MVNRIQFYLKTILLVGFLGWFQGFPAMAQDIPPIEITIYDSAATTGYYFMIPYRAMFPYPYDHPQLILDQYGRIIYYSFPSGSSGLGSSTLDFKIHDNGWMSYWSAVFKKFYLMDSTFVVFDSIGVVNGVEPDAHELIINDEGHFFLLGRESRYMDLSGYHWFGMNHTQPGSVNAEVLGTVIQEFDENKNLVWEWKALDHYAFADVDSIWLTNPKKVSWSHTNAIEEDDDGNLMISHRHFNEITKINHPGGNIIWRLGGKSNQFNFVNDPVGFTGQHDIRRNDNGNITLMDNGQYNAGSMARGVEYTLNENQKIATLVYEYIHDSSMYSTSLGSHQLLPNGNHLIDFGTVPDAYPWMVVAKPDYSLVLELDCHQGYVRYRAYNYDTLPWALNRPEITCVKNGDDYFLEAEDGYPEYRWSTGAKTQSIPINDTGTFYVYVPYGQGYLASEFFIVSDPDNPCNFVANEFIKPHSQALGLAISPNPASGEPIKVNFTIPEGTKGVLTLIDLTGKTIQLMPDKSFGPGLHQHTLSAGSLSPGIYFCVLQSESRRLIKKIIIY